MRVRLAIAGHQLFRFEEVSQGCLGFVTLRRPVGYHRSEVIHDDLVAAETIDHRLDTRVETGTSPPPVRIPTLMALRTYRPSSWGLVTGDSGLVVGPLMIAPV
jgi:hypothetical protein